MNRYKKVEGNASNNDIEMHPLYNPQSNTQTRCLTIWYSYEMSSECEEI